MPSLTHTTFKITNFLKQDDALIESLLCLLDIFTGLHFGVYSLRHQGIGGSGIELEVGTDSSKLLQEALDPLDGFYSFLQVLNQICAEYRLEGGIT